MLFCFIWVEIRSTVAEQNAQDHKITTVIRLLF